MIWLHLGLYSCWLMYWLNKPSSKRTHESNMRKKTSVIPRAFLSVRTNTMAAYLSQLCLSAPHRHQSLLAAPVGRAGGLAWGAPELFESSSAATRRPLCSYAVGSASGKGGWLPVLGTIRTWWRANWWVQITARMLGPHPTQHRVYQTRVKPNDTEGWVLRLKAFFKNKQRSAWCHQSSILHYAAFTRIWTQATFDS